MKPVIRSNTSPVPWKSLCSPHMCALHSAGMTRCPRTQHSDRQWRPGCRSAGMSCSPPLTEGFLDPLGLGKWGGSREGMDTADKLGRMGLLWPGPAPGPRGISPPSGGWRWKRRVDVLEPPFPPLRTKGPRSRGWRSPRCWRPVAGSWVSTARRRRCRPGCCSSPSRKRTASRPGSQTQRSPGSSRTPGNHPAWGFGEGWSRQLRAKGWRRHLGRGLWRWPCRSRHQTPPRSHRQPRCWCWATRKQTAAPSGHWCPVPVWHWGQCLRSQSWDCHWAGSQSGFVHRACYRKQKWFKTRS